MQAPSDESGIASQFPLSPIFPTHPSHSPVNPIIPTLTRNTGGVGVSHAALGTYMTFAMTTIR